MSRDALIRGNVIIFIDRSPGDVTGLSDGASLICEADWLALRGEIPEEEYIKSLGLVST